MIVSHTAKIIVLGMALTFSNLCFGADTDADALAAITARNNQFRAAVVAQDAAAAAEIYDQNVVFMAPDISTLRGKDSVHYFFQQQIRGGVVDIQLKTEEIRLLKAPGSEGKFQYEEIGTNLLTVNVGGGQTVQIPGKYIVIWDFKDGLKSAPFIFRDSFSFSVAVRK